MSEPALLGGKPVFSKNHRWPQWPRATEADERRLLRVVRGGAWGIGCPETAGFAARFAESLGCKHVLPVTSGTAALELAVKALGIGPGDEVIVPSYTFVASANCVLQMGATVVFADVDPATFNLDPRSVAECLTPRTRAILPVHFGGNPCDMAGLKRVIRGRDIAVIEDAAHAHGMRYRGRPGGTLGKVGAFSFQSSKNMAAGERGALVTDDDAVFELAWSFHSFGRLPKQEWYDHAVLSWNHRMTGLQAALLIGQLRRLEAQTQRRYENAALLDRALAQMPGQTPQKPGDTRPGTRRAHHLYLWRYDAEASGLDRETFLEALRAEGVGAWGGYTRPLQEQSMFLHRRFWHEHFMGGKRRRRGEPDYSRVRTPGAKALCREAVWLSQQDLLASRREIQGIADAVAKVLGAADRLRAFARERKRD